jgi:hypothetical protein
MPGASADPPVRRISPAVLARLRRGRGRPVALLATVADLRAALALPGTRAILADPARVVGVQIGGTRLELANPLHRALWHLVLDRLSRPYPAEPAAPRTGRRRTRPDASAAAPSPRSARPQPQSTTRASTAAGASPEAADRTTTARSGGEGGRSRGRRDR